MLARKRDPVRKRYPNQTTNLARKRDPVRASDTQKKSKDERKGTGAIEVRNNFATCGVPAAVCM